MDENSSETDSNGYSEDVVFSMSFSSYCPPNDPPDLPAEETHLSAVEDLRSVCGIVSDVTKYTCASLPQASQTQELVRELLGAVDSGNATGVRQVLQEPGIVVNGTNKVCEACTHCKFLNPPLLM